uniref:Methyltransferase domain-containing protein n=1 Tax=Moniliophthora roreri TaxID=221103 RepID=A0A0W0F3W7_MONRR
MTIEDLQSKSAYAVLKRGHGESERLNQQYQFYKKLHHRNLISAWILEVAQELPSSVSLYAVDIAPTLWPGPSSGIPSNVHYFVSSVTSLPKQWTNKFNLVNQSLLSVALKAVDWPTSISELYRVTKPGGYIQLVEMSRIPPFPRGTGPASNAVWELYNRMAVAAGFLTTPMSEVPLMLEEAGFCDVTVQVEPAAIGGKRFGGDNGVEALDVLEKAFVALKDIFMVNQGFGVVKKEEYDGLIERYLREIEETGARAGMELCYICARKGMRGI